APEAGGLHEDRAGSLRIGGEAANGNDAGEDGREVDDAPLRVIVSAAVEIVAADQGGVDRAASVDRDEVGGGNDVRVGPLPRAAPVRAAEEAAGTGRRSGEGSR